MSEKMSINPLKFPARSGIFFINLSLGNQLSNSITSNPIVLTGSLPSYKTALAAAVPNAGKNNGSYGTLQTLRGSKLRWVAPPASSTLSVGDPISGTILELMNSGTGGVDVVIDYYGPVLVQDLSVDVWPGGSLLIW